MSLQSKTGNREVWKSLFGGAIVGVIVGLMVSGPKFHSWPIGEIFKVVFGCTAIGAFVGCMFVPLLAGSLAKGNTPGIGIHGRGGAAGSDGVQSNLLNQLDAVSHDHSNYQGPGDYPGP